MSRADELAREQRHLDTLYARLDTVRDDTRRRLAEVRRQGAGGTPQHRSERDAFATLYEDRLAQLDAVEANLCFGRLDLADGRRLHIGRIGLTDDAHDTLLVDWRAPAAEPFYRATPAERGGVVRRRQLRTRGRRLLDIEDDLVDVEALDDADLDTLGGGGALLAAVTARRTGRMHDIVATIQAEQDRVIRAEAGGALVVQGGPGTGKTAVALHRAAYLLYTLRDRLGRAGVLVVGPGAAFLRYIDQVLPSLGETGVVLSTLPGLAPGLTPGATEVADVAAVKADLRMAAVVEAAVRATETVPRADVVVGLEEHELTLTPADVAAARRRARRSRRGHNRARYAFARSLLRTLVGELAERDAELAGERWAVRALMTSEAFRSVVDDCWPRLSAEQLVARLLTPAGIRAAAGILTDSEQELVVRDPGSPWTDADAALLDEAYRLLGDPDEMLAVAARRRAERADRAYAREVLDQTGLGGRVDAATLARRYAGPDSGSGSVTESALSDPMWEYGHVIVDEAQELSPMQWRMLARRDPTRSMTVVGDVAQAANAWGGGSWEQTLEVVDPPRLTVAELTVNYRTPGEVMELAARVLARTHPGLAPPTSVRDSGRPPVATAVAAETDLPVTVATLTETALADTGGGKAAVVAPDPLVEPVLEALAERMPGRCARGADGLDTDVAVLTATQAKGLEFDVVVVVEPAYWVDLDRLSDLYVALTRPTQRLDVVHTGALPDLLAPMASAVAPAPSLTP